MLPALLTSRFKPFVWLGMVLAWGMAMAAPAVAGQAGEIVFASGAATVNGAAAVAGTKVMEGAQLATGDGGTLYLKTVDQGFFILRERSKATITTYDVRPNAPTQSRIKIDFERGVARHISGDAVKQSRQNFRFNTPVAAIGVRGTDFTVFADTQVMRVNVNAGGIVVGALSNACTLAGTGPCEGPLSRDLFAGEPNLLLQVRRGAPQPELIKSVELRPDAVAPPRPDEPPPAKPATSGSANPAGTNQTSGATAATAKPVGATDTGAPTADLIVPATTEVAVARSQALPAVLAPIKPDANPVKVVPREVVWGRWTAVADSPREAAKLALVAGPDYLPASFADAYFLARTANDTFTLPSQGRFAFSMTGGEAHIVNANGVGGVASIQNPQLEIDFAQREFGTSLQVVRGSTTIDVRARGDVTTQGELLSDLLRSNTLVRGQLSGTAGQGASYIFNRQTDNGLRAIGGINWAR